MKRHSNHKERVWGLLAGIIAGLILAVVWGVSKTQAADQQIEGVTVAESVAVADTRLILNGAGVRNKFFMPIYVAALYLPVKAATFAEVSTQTGPKQLLLHFIHKEVSPEKLVTAWNDGFKANLTPAELTALAPVIAQFNQYFNQAAVKGMVYRLTYLPTQGTQVWINDQLKGTLPGAEFYTALLKIWLGEKPVTADLKQALLGSVK